MEVKEKRTSWINVWENIINNNWMLCVVQVLSISFQGIDENNSAHFTYNDSESIKLLCM